MTLDPTKLTPDLGSSQQAAQQLEGQVLGVELVAALSPGGGGGLFIVIFKGKQASLLLNTKSHEKKKNF